MQPLLEGPLTLSTALLMRCPAAQHSTPASVPLMHSADKLVNTKLGSTLTTSPVAAAAAMM